MGPKLPLVLLSLLIATACAHRSAFSETELEKRRTEVANRITVHDLVTTPDFEYDWLAILRDAAYEMVEGMSLEQATRTFEADGTRCDEGTCTWASRVREPVAVLFPPAIRPPGPRRATDHVRQVTIKSAAVTRRSDIAVGGWTSAVAKP